jgi:hypothetical protein
MIEFLQGFWWGVVCGLMILAIVDPAVFGGEGRR